MPEPRCSFTVRADYARPARDADRATRDTWRQHGVNELGRVTVGSAGAHRTAMVREWR